jgi:hypothetical protein
MTIAKVKRTLSRATGVPPSNIRLCLGSLVLEDKLTPGDIDLSEGSVIRMFVVADPVDEEEGRYDAGLICTYVCGLSRVVSLRLCCGKEPTTSYFEHSLYVKA